MQIYYFLFNPPAYLSLNSNNIEVCQQKNIYIKCVYVCVLHTTVYIYWKREKEKEKESAPVQE